MRSWLIFIAILAFEHASRTVARRTGDLSPPGISHGRPRRVESPTLTRRSVREGELNDTYTDGTSLKVYIRIKTFNDRGRRYAEVQLPYRVELGGISDVQARTIRPDGSMIEVESRDVFDKVLLKTRHGIWRAKVFTMPAVEAGAIIEYRYRQTYPMAFATSRSIFKGLVHPGASVQHSAADCIETRRSLGHVQRPGPTPFRSHLERLVRDQG